MEIPKDNSSEDEEFPAGSFSDDDVSYYTADAFEELSMKPVIAIFGNHFRSQNIAEKAAAKELFCEMTFTCAKAFIDIKVKTLCFNETWFNAIFKDDQSRIFCFPYSACQPLLSKYAQMFVDAMKIMNMKVLDDDSLDMLEISFEPEGNLWNTVAFGPI